MFLQLFYLRSRWPQWIILLSQGFFHESVSPVFSWVSHWGHFKFLLKFTKIFATLCFSPAPLLPAINYGQSCVVDTTINSSTVSWNRWKSGTRLYHQRQGHQRQFIVGNNDTSDKHKVGNIFVNIHQNFKWPQWNTQGTRGNWSMKKPENENLISDSWCQR